MTPAKNDGRLLRTRLRQFGLAPADFLTCLLHLLDRRRASVYCVARLDRASEVTPCALASIGNFFFGLIALLRSTFFFLCLLLVGLSRVA